MNFLTKRVINNVFVSNKSLIQLKYFHTFLLNKPIVDKNNCNFGNNYIERQTKRMAKHLFSYSVIKRHFSDTDSSEDESEVSKQSKELKKSMETKFKIYSDKDSEVIYDVSEELMSRESKSDSVMKEWNESEEEVYLYQEKQKKSTPIEMKRGLTGVFDIEELVQLLRKENLREIAVIRVPEELNYCEYLVLANATSKRHINAFFEYFNKIYKMKKWKKDPFLDLGGKEALDWKVVDMKNIVLHVFQKDVREYYDIETLWTVGHEFDDKIQRPETDSVVDIMEKHIKFLREIKAN